MLDNYQDMLTLDEVCQILRINRKTLRYLINSGQLPYRRIGRIYRISKDAVRQYIATSLINS